MLLVLLATGCAGLDPVLSPKDILRDADLAYAERDRADARTGADLLEEALARRPDDPEALWRLARLEVFLGRPHAAWRRAERAAELEPGSAQAALWAGYAGALEIASRPVGERLAEAPAVLGRLERATRLDPGLARAHLGLAILSLALEEEPSPAPFERPDAALHLSLARELRPGLPEPHLLLARRLLAAGDPQGARHELEVLLGPPPEERDGPHFPEAQIAEWFAARESARAMLALIPPSPR
ncbi:MAG: hypothetical protein HY720_00575 [Planctomycetes bacterium]|nr:hypothetical protein [Planctomycetota bacterium]